MRRLCAAVFFVLERRLLRVPDRFFPLDLKKKPDKISGHLGLQPFFSFFIFGGFHEKVLDDLNASYRSSFRNQLR